MKLMFRFGWMNYKICRSCNQWPAGAPNVVKLTGTNITTRPFSKLCILGPVNSLMIEKLWSCSCLPFTSSCLSIPFSILSTTVLREGWESYTLSCLCSSSTSWSCFCFTEVLISYSAYIGLCKEKSKLGLYIYLNPLAIVIEIVISIIDFLGFNGFIRVVNMFNAGNAAAGIFGLVVSILWILIAVWSGFLYFRICKQRSILTQALLWFLICITL